MATRFLQSAAPSRLQTDLRGKASGGRWYRPEVFGCRGSQSARFL